MLKSRHSPRRKAKSVRVHRKAAPASEAVLTLPPAPADSSTTPPLAISVPAKEESPAIQAVRRIPKNSVIRQKALAIMAMRLAGHDNETIAKELQLSQGSLNQYLWMAGKNGWIPRKRGFADPKDSLEFSLAHKVVKNLGDLLDSEDAETKKEVTLEVAKGTLFKRFSDQNAQAPQTTVLAVRIEMPAGEPTIIRERTTGGRGRWIEGEVDAG